MPITGHNPDQFLSISHACNIQSAHFLRGFFTILLQIFVFIIEMQSVRYNYGKVPGEQSDYIHALSTICIRPLKMCLLYLNNELLGYVPTLYAYRGGFCAYYYNKTLACKVYIAGLYQQNQMCYLVTDYLKFFFCLPYFTPPPAISQVSYVGICNSEVPSLAPIITHFSCVNMWRH